MDNIVHNPVINLDYPDPDVIRVGDTYYMTTTSVHFIPAVPILCSKDLNHWELVSYVTDIFADNEKHRLENGQSAYGSGVWATTLRYHNGSFYLLFNCNEEQNTYIYRTKDIRNGPWEKSILPGMHHDLSLFYDDDDRAYIIYGNGTIYITELTEDAREVKEGGVNQILVDPPRITGLNCEGSHFYKINGYYYLFMINWPADGSRRRLEWCYRSDTLLGSYEGRKLTDSAMNYYNNGVAQGGIFDTAEGSWYAMLFQDRFAAGRFPVLVPVTWSDGWPLMGKDGSGKVEEEVLVRLPLQQEGEPLYGNDEFEYNRNEELKLFWQWNHNPDNSAWSVTERPGWLRLKNRNPRMALEWARNTLTQRVPFPGCICEAKLDMKGMVPGDMAGIAAFQAHYGYVGVKVDLDGAFYAVYGISDGNGTVTEKRIKIHQGEIWLKIGFDFRDGYEKANDLACFMFSLDGVHWNEWDAALRMTYSLEHFSGYRIALYSYNEKESDGYADFDYLRMETKMFEIN